MKKLNWLLAVFLIFASPAVAGDDVAAAQSIIRSQLAAMDRDDAASAYSFASPEIRGMFQEADSFMTMVRRNYAAVYRHKSFEFGESRAESGKVIQVVTIVDAEGVPWQAIYTLGQQSDGSVKITGCSIKAIGTPA